MPDRGGVTTGDADAIIGVIDSGLADGPVWRWDAVPEEVLDLLLELAKVQRDELKRWKIEAHRYNATYPQMKAVADAAVKLLKPPYRRGMSIQLPHPEEPADWDALRKALGEAGWEWEEYT